MVQQYWQCLWSSGTGLIPSPGLWNSMMSQSDQKKILLKSLKKKKKKRSQASHYLPRPRLPWESPALWMTTSWMLSCNLGPMGLSP